MTNEIATIDPKEFGLQETQVTEIQAAFMPKIVERDGLAEIYSGIITQEICPELCKTAKELRLKLVKVRTGIAEIHKTQKAFYLAAGRYVDAWKNKETLPVTQMEENLSAIEEHYERIEAQKRAALQTERAAELQKFSDEGAFIPGNLGELLPEVWDNYLLGVKTAYETKKENERKAADAEAARVAAEKAEQERIRQENERLKAEAEQREKERKEQAERERKEREAHEAALKAERDEKERIQRELEAKAEAERKAAEAAELAKQAELAKGDSDKVKDLISDLVALKTKYTFQSKKNQKMYSDVGQLLEKVINFVQS
jgi:hypothetical protein